MRFLMVLGSDSCDVFKESSVLVQRPVAIFPCCSEMNKLDTTPNLGGTVLLVVNSLWRLRENRNIVTLICSFSRGLVPSSMKKITCFACKL